VNQLVQAVVRLNFADQYAENATNFIAFFVDLQNAPKKVVLRDTNSIINSGVKSGTFATFVV
jgi:hypothetical protein